MPFVSHRSAAGRTFDCVYDPTYTAASEKEEQQAGVSALSNAAMVQIFPKYDAMFEDAPKTSRMTYRKQLNELSPHGIKRHTERVNFESFMVIGPEGSRLRGGANNPSERKVEYTSTSPSECKRKAPGLYFSPPTPNVNVIDVKLSDSKTTANSKKAARHNECRYYGDPPKCKRIKTRGTQTLYRESSAQTLPYLPGTVQDKKELENFELFKLPDILPGDGPPGLYEVEVLERARKRWSFSKALKENFQRQLEEAKEKAKLPQHHNILEAFEWEKWIEREEYIQECQMMRLDLVIRMFDQREKEMHEASKTRIELSYEKIMARRDADLLRNEKEYGRAIRRLEKKHRHVSRNWRKENITKELGNASSEFYAPQMRYGVNPSRRSFQIADRKSFTSAMDNLEKHVVNMSDLVCPFAKLKEWSKPKGRLMEVEQNFCSDDNLKKLYESLKNLRAQSAKQKSIPKCLIEKVPKTKYQPPPQPAYPRASVPESIFEYQDTLQADVGRRPSSVEVEKRKEFEELRSQSVNVQKRLQRLINEKRLEEIEGMVAHYEGTSIGWLMRFLSEEMGRLQELRRMHFIIMLAQKERWRREAAEAGLRQKENDMRYIYEELYQATDDANTNVCQEYLDNILTVDTRDYADEKATHDVTELAKAIDRDIERWLKSFILIQNPLNFEMLRYMLRDLVFPDIEEVLKHYESQLVMEYIINELFGLIWEGLEPFDISLAIADDMVDRLIDNDLYIMTPECRSQCDCSTCCLCPPAKCETSAILRKVIRYAVPGRRWRTPTERIADENVKDLLEDIFGTMAAEGRLTLPFEESKDTALRKATSCLNLLSSPRYEELYLKCSSEDSFRHTRIKKLDRSSAVDHVASSAKGQEPFDMPLRVITSKYDVLEGQLQPIESLFGEPDKVGGAPKHLVASEFISTGIVFDEEQLERLNKTTYKFLRHIIIEVIRSFVPHEESDNEQSDSSVETHDDDETLHPADFPSSFEYNASIYGSEQQDEVNDDETDENLMLEEKSEIESKTSVVLAEEQLSAAAEAQIIGEESQPDADEVLAPAMEKPPSETFVLNDNTEAIVLIDTSALEEIHTVVIIDEQPETLEKEEQPPVEQSQDEQLSAEEPPAKQLSFEQPANPPVETDETEPPNST